MPYHSPWYRYYGRVLTTRVVAHGEEGVARLYKSHSITLRIFFLPFLSKAIQHHCASIVTAQHRMIDMVLHDFHEN